MPNFKSISIYILSCVSFFQCVVRTALCFDVAVSTTSNARHCQRRAACGLSWEESEDRVFVHAVCLQIFDFGIAANPTTATKASSDCMLSCGGFSCARERTKGCGEAKDSGIHHLSALFVEQARADDLPISSLLTENFSMFNAGPAEKCQAVLGRAVVDPNNVLVRQLGDHHFLLVCEHHQADIVFPDNDGMTPDVDKKWKGDRAFDSKEVFAARLQLSDRLLQLGTDNSGVSPTRTPRGSPTTAIAAWPTRQCCPSTATQPRSQTSASRKTFI